MPRAVIFDLGDTVLEEKSYDISSGFKKISAYLSPDISLADLADSIAESQDGVHEFLLAKWIETNMGIQSESMSVHDLELLFWEATVKLVQKPGIRQVLDFLLNKGVRVAAISNAIFSSNCMRFELAKHQLDPYFEFVISSADHGVRKPDAAIFAQASKALGIESCDMWYIGDKWDVDVSGAVSADMTAIWFSNQSRVRKPNIEHIKLESWANFESVWIENA